MEKIKQEKEEMAKKREQTAWLGGNILDRQTKSPNNPNAIITLPANYTLDTAPVRDTNSAPASFELPVIQVNSGEVPGASKHDENDNERPVKSNSLLVPDRVSMEYKDDEDESPASPAPTPSSAVGISIAVPTIAVPSEVSSVTILLSKKRTSLGKLPLLFYHCVVIVLSLFHPCSITVRTFIFTLSPILDSPRLIYPCPVLCSFECVKRGEGGRGTCAHERCI